MLPQVSTEDYKALQLEMSECYEDPAAWAGYMLRKLETENPTIHDFLWDFFKRFKDHPCKVPAVFCALGVYYLLDVANKEKLLPTVHPEIGAPMQVQVLRDSTDLLNRWSQRISDENPVLNTLFVDQAMQCQYMHGGTEKDAQLVLLAGAIVYQYLASQDEVNELNSQ